MPHCCDHHISNVRHLASLAPLHCLGKPARGRHHSSGSRPTGDSAGSPLRSGVSWLGMALVAACFLAEDGALEAHAFRRPLLSRQCRHACPVHLPCSGRGTVNRTPEILLPKQATCHWPTPRLTGCGRRIRTGSPAYETGVLPLHHLRIVMAPQVRIERTTTRLTAARSAS